jgi:hypothetical protein
MSWLSPDEFAAVVEAAARAPSMHSPQPWRFRLGQASIDLLVDPDRQPPATDPSGWASRLACGAALYNLRLALTVRGRPALVRLSLDHGDRYLVARLTPDPPRPPTRTELRLYRALPRRFSNRAAFSDRRVPVETRTELIAAANDEKAWLDLLLGPAAVEATAGLVQAAQEILHRDAGGEEVPSHHAFESEPLIAVLGGHGDWPADQVQTGQALQRVWLTAAAFGLAASLFPQPIQVAAVREELRLALGRCAVPQMVMRFGYE